MLKSFMSKFQKPKTEAGFSKEDIVSLAKSMGGDARVSDVFANIFDHANHCYDPKITNPFHGLSGLSKREIVQSQLEGLNRQQRAAVLLTAIHGADRLLPPLDPSPFDREKEWFEYSQDNERRNYSRSRGMQILESTFAATIRKKAALTSEQIADMLEIASTLQEQWQDRWSIPQIIRQLEWNIKASPPSDETMARLRAFAFHRWVNKQSTYYGSDRGKAHMRLTKLTGLHTVTPTDPDAPVQAIIKFGDSPFEVAVEASFDSASSSRKIALNRLFMVAKTKFGAKPSAKTAKELTDLKKGQRNFDEVLLGWFEAATVSSSFQRPSQELRRYVPIDIPQDFTQSLLKTSVWALADSKHANLIPFLQRLGMRSFESVAGHGIRALGLGNAVIAILAKQGLPGLAALSSIRLKVRQPSVRKKIDALIDKEARALGVSRTTLQEMAIPTLGLTLGRRQWDFEGYTLTLDASKPGKSALTWAKPNGGTMKSVPSIVKKDAKLAEQLKAARAVAKEAKSALSTQRDRIDGLFIDDPEWAADVHKSAYLDHALVGPLSRTLIWTADDVPALYRNDGWEDVEGNPIRDVSTVGLWHPIQSEPDDVLAWRKRLADLEIRQPFKQAHREVYLLTDAEINTETYSNRMAAHILKQHQFRALAGLRGWSYTLLGAYDDGRDNEIAKRPIPASNLVAEFWIDEMLNAHEEFNDAGIWNYVATDQVRFIDAETETIVPLNLVPPLVFSEVMRECDLFVGVASVGNDPMWLDAGGTRTETAQRYWQDYAFGDLSKLAETRKEILSALLPRLKISDKTKIDGKFLEVQGQRHRYRIHIGSTNIQIMPSNRYLCVVPGRSKDLPQKTFLPFEGDRGLAVVLSKAFMLVDDHSITDRTILSQL